MFDKLVNISWFWIQGLSLPLKKVSLTKLADMMSEFRFWVCLTAAVAFRRDYGWLRYACAFLGVDVAAVWAGGRDDLCDLGLAGSIEVVVMAAGAVVLFFCSVFVF